MYYMKVCYKCKVLQPKGEFCKDRTRPDGFSYYCKTCNKIYYKRKIDTTRYKRHQEENLKRQLAYRCVPGIRLAGLLSQAKRRAPTKNLSYDLDIEWAMALYNAQEGRCLLTGIPFVLESKPEDKRKRNNPFSPSLDRIDSDKGYTKANCRLVCTNVNMALNRFGEDVFEYMCKSYLAHKGIKVG